MLLKMKRVHITCSLIIYLLSPEILFDKFCLVIIVRIIILNNKIGNKTVYVKYITLNTKRHYGAEC